MQTLALIGKADITGGHWAETLIAEVNTSK
jgi:hypothetical protein